MFLKHLCSAISFLFLNTKYINFNEFYDSLDTDQRQDINTSRLQLQQSAGQTGGSTDRGQVKQLAMQTDTRIVPDGSSGSLTMRQRESVYSMSFSWGVPQACLPCLRLFSCLHKVCGVLYTSKYKR